MGRPGLDPGTLGLKGTVLWLLCVGLVENSLCFNENRVVSCRSGLVVLQKYEAYNEACSDLVARSLRGHFQVRVTAVRARVHVGSPTPTQSDSSKRQ